MNMTAVYEHVAEMLQTQVTLWSKDHQLQGVYSHRRDMEDLFLQRDDFLDAMLDDLGEFPLLAVINAKLVYMIVPLNDVCGLVGPVHLFFPENVYRQIILSEEPSFPHLYTFSADDVLNYGLLLFRLIEAHTISAYECARRNYKFPMSESAMRRQSETVYQFREEGQPHNSYEQEKRMLSAIEKGDYGLLEQAQGEQSGGELGVSSRDPIRNGKNLALSLITLASRACIRGGVDPEVGFTLCDSYMQQVEALETMNDMKRLPAMIEHMLYTMTSLTHEIRSSRHQSEDHEDIPIIHSCKKYVSRHLHEKLTVQNIAEALSIHPNYLTSLFSREEGLSLYQYILSEKLRTARDLLIYSVKPISEIANTLTFSSQSHFGKLFRDKYGMTPKEYRDKYGQRKG